MRCAIRWAENTSREKEPDLVRRKKKDPSPDLIRNALGTIGLKSLLSERLEIYK